MLDVLAHDGSEIVDSRGKTSAKVLILMDTALQTIAIWWLAGFNSSEGIYKLTLNLRIETAQQLVTGSDQFRLAHLMFFLLNFHVILWQSNMNMGNLWSMVHLVSGTIIYSLVI